MSDEEKLLGLIEHHRAVAEHHYEIADTARWCGDRVISLAQHALAESHDDRAAELEALL